MKHRSQLPLFAAALAIASLLAAVAFAQTRTPQAPRNDNPAGMAGQMAAMRGMESGRPDPHMLMTELQPPQPGDRKRADAVVVAVRQTMEKYQDYRVALADGFRIFAPSLPGKEKHFTNYRWAAEAQFHFNPYHPTSLLYDRTPGGWKLVGAMFTAPRSYTLAQLNERIPLSVARWHRHVDFCFPPQADLRQLRQQRRESSGQPDPRLRDEFLKYYGITDQNACNQVGGRWLPQLFGWMVHVYPYAKNSAAVWAPPDMHMEPPPPAAH